MNVTAIKSQISNRKDELSKLKEVEAYLYENFAATTQEMDKVFDVIAQCKDRKEAQILNLKGMLLTAM